MPRFPYLPKLNPEVGRGLGGLPIRRDTTPEAEELISFAGMSIPIYDSKSFNTDTETALPIGVLLSQDGSKMYVCDFAGGGGGVFEYDLGTDFDVTTAVHNSQMIAEDATLASDIWMSPDGTKIFILYQTGDIIHQHTLNIPFELGSDGGSETTFSIAEDTAVQGLAMSQDGTRMYVSGQSTDRIYEYILLDPFNISSAVLNFTFDPSDASVAQLFCSPNGDALYYMDDVGDQIFRITMTTPFDLSTGVKETQTIDNSAQDAASHGIAFADNGRKMYVTGDINDSVYQYRI